MGPASTLEVTSLLSPLLTMSTTANELRYLHVLDFNFINWTGASFVLAMLASLRLSMGSIGVFVKSSVRQQSSSP